MIIQKNSVDEIYDFFQNYNFPMYRKTCNISKEIILKPNSLLEIEISPQQIIDLYNPKINYLDMSKDFDISTSVFKLYNYGGNLPCKIEWFSYYGKSNVLNIDISLNKNKKEKCFLINGQYIPKFKHLYKNYVTPQKKIQINIEKYSLILNHYLKIKFNNRCTIAKILNIPLSQYKNFQLYENGLLFNIDTNQWYSNKKNENTFMNLLTDISKNGLNNTIMFNYTNSNYFYKEAMTKFYIARILELPYIPSIIINTQDFY